MTYEFAAYLEGDVLAVTATQTPCSSTWRSGGHARSRDWWRERIRAFEGDDLEAA